MLGPCPTAGGTKAGIWPPHPEPLLASPLHPGQPNLQRLLAKQVGCSLQQPQESPEILQLYILIKRGKGTTNLTGWE